MYNLQAPAVLPDCPTWRLFGSQPASAMGREQPQGRAQGIRQLTKLRHLGLFTDASADGQNEFGRVISTSSPAAISMNSRPAERLVTRGGSKAVMRGEAASAGGLNTLPRIASSTVRRPGKSTSTLTF